MYQHDGLISGYSSVIFFVPEFKIGGAFVGNSENAGSIGSGIVRIPHHFPRVSVADNELDLEGNSGRTRRGPAIRKT